MTTNFVNIPEEAEAAARRHAVSEYPKESCGVVADNVYHPIPNIHKDPEKHFEMPDETWSTFKVQAVIHSHSPQYKLEPSADDMAHQISSGVPWGIVLADDRNASKVLWFGDFILDTPLVGRQWVHGVTDCYAAIRSWFWQNRKVKLLDYPRDMNWWQGDEDIYTANFHKVGAKEIQENEATVGDVCLMNIRSSKPNHGGVLIEDGLLYHHLQNRLSAREPLGRWKPFITKWLRYEG